MRLAKINRYPVKSLGGEALDAVDVHERGLDGDRLWAVRDPDGKIGSGKNTRRFRRMPGLLSLRSMLTARGPLVEVPTGDRFVVGIRECDAAVAAALGRQVTVAREDVVLHHDEGPVSFVSTAALRQLADWHGTPVDVRRLRANLLIDTGSATGIPEDGWLGQTIAIGAEVVLEPQRAITRCVMVDLPQDELPGDGRLLGTISTRHDLTFGVWATVVRTGRIRQGDRVTIG